MRVTTRGHRATWDELVMEGIEAASRMDAERWRLGSLGAQVDRHYGEESLAKYATDIGVVLDRLYEYTAVYTFYAQYSVRAEILSYSHYRSAMRFKLAERAIRALVKAANRGWTVHKFDRFISRWRRLFDTDYTPRPTAPRKTSRILGASYTEFAAYARLQDGALILTGDDIPSIVDGLQYRVLLIDTSTP